MKTQLIKSAYLITMSDELGDIENGALFIQDGVIKNIGHVDEITEVADEVIDISNHAIYPGLVNTHHHFYQTLTRAIPSAQNSGLFEWLKTLYPI